MFSEQIFSSLHFHSMKNILCGIEASWKATQMRDSFIFSRDFSPRAWVQACGRQIHIASLRGYLLGGEKTRQLTGLSAGKNTSELVWRLISNLFRICVVQQVFVQIQDSAYKVEEFCMLRLGENPCGGILWLKEYMKLSYFPQFPQFHGHPPGKTQIWMINFSHQFQFITTN